MNESADVADHWSLARRRRAGVLRVEAVAFEKPAKRNVIPTVKIHINYPRGDAEFGCDGYIGAVTGKEDAQPLLVEGIENIFWSRPSTATSRRVVMILFPVGRNVLPIVAAGERHFVLGGSCDGAY